MHVVLQVRLKFWVVVVREDRPNQILICNNFRLLNNVRNPRLEIWFWLKCSTAFETSLAGRDKLQPSSRRTERKETLFMSHKLWNLRSLIFVKSKKLENFFFQISFYLFQTDFSVRAAIKVDANVRIPCAFITPNHHGGAKYNLDIDVRNIIN